MGREKEYRQRLKYQVSCVRRKTLESQIAGELRNELGLSPAEARLLSRRMAVWLQSKEGFRCPNQIVMEASAGKNHFIRNGKGPTVGVTLSPFEVSTGKFSRTRDVCPLSRSFPEGPDSFQRASLHLGAAGVPAG